MSHPNEIPQGWTKGEKLITKENRYKKQHYIVVPERKVEEGATMYIDFESEQALKVFLEWWDAK